MTVLYGLVMPRLDESEPRIPYRRCDCNCVAVYGPPPVDPGRELERMRQALEQIPQEDIDACVTAALEMVSHNSPTEPSPPPFEVDESGMYEHDPKPLTPKEER